VPDAEAQISINLKKVMAAGYVIERAQPARGKTVYRACRHNQVLFTAEGDDDETAVTELLLAMRDVLATTP
jgi:hypothetical protein